MTTALRMMVFSGWIVLLTSFTAGAQEKKPAGKGIDPATVAAYQKLGGTYGGLKERIGEQPGSRDFEFVPGAKAAEEGVPGFEFVKRGPTEKLPAVNVPFGLVFWGDMNDEELGRIVHLVNLDFLHVWNNSLTDAGLQQLAGLKSLRAFYLGGPSPSQRKEITEAGLKELKRLPKLSKLSLGSSVADAGLKEIAGLRHLNYLRLKHSRISPMGLFELAPLKNLTTLDVRETLNDEGMRVLHQIGLLHAIRAAAGKNGARPRSSAEVVSLKTGRAGGSGKGIWAGFGRLGSGRYTDLALRELQDLTNLTELDLSGQAVTDFGLKDLATHKKLTTLNLSGTQATDAGLRHLAPLRNLTALDLSDTQVTDGGLKDLAPLKKLTTLTFDIELVTDTGLRSLRHIGLLHSLAHCVEKPRETFPGKPGRVEPTPRSIALVHCEGKDGARPKTPAEVTALCLRSAPITAAGLKELAPLKNLATLTLDASVLTDAGLSNLREMNMLHVLDVAWAEDFLLPKSSQDVFLLDLSRTGISDAGLKELAGFSNLSVLYLDRTKVTDTGLKHLAGFKKLTSLHLNATEVTDAGLKELLALKNLNTLHLQNKKVSSAGMKTLAKLENLSELSLAGTSVTDSGLKELAALKNLAMVYVERAPVTDAGVAFLRRALPRCQLSRTSVSFWPGPSLPRRGVSLPEE